MGEVTKFPGEYKRPAVITGAQIHATSEPSDLMVWEVCPYTRGGEMVCQQCPATVEDENYGQVVLGCRHRAAEACRVVMAVQAMETNRGKADSNRDGSAESSTAKDD